jgi:hypothetical protein
MDTTEIVTREEYLAFGDYTSADGLYHLRKSYTAVRDYPDDDDNITHLLDFLSPKGAAIEITIDAFGWLEIKVNGQPYFDPENGYSEISETEKIAQPLRGLVEGALGWTQELYYKAHREFQALPAYDQATEEARREGLKKKSQHLLDDL